METLKLGMGSTKRQQIANEADFPLFSIVRNLTQCMGVYASRGKGEGVSRERDAQYWLDLAEEARSNAERMTYADTKREMLRIAASYERLAEHAERTAGKKPR